MSRVIIACAHEQGERLLELGERDAVLIGRAPAPELPTLGLEGDPQQSYQTIALPVASVSANHLLIWAHGGQVYLRDLGSRNGTWLLLPRAETVSLRQTDLTFELARSAPPETAGGDEPQEPSWQASAEFATAVAASIERWPRLRAWNVEVRLVSPSDSSANGIPLANGEAIALSPRATADASWSSVLEKLWRWVARQNSLFEAEERTREEGVVLASPAIRSAHRALVEAARSSARALLLMGPSGAGKEMLAEAFHRHSGRSGPFVAINCAMFNKELLRSELFGAEAGSFTGATRRIVGAVERAQGGTLFLDEIGDLPLEVQPMLLRFLDRREYEPLGQYGKAQRADVCVIGATNRDLRAAARDGQFRADLWYRLSVRVIDVPGLRQRWEDIVAYLSASSIDGAACSLFDALSPQALELLRAHAWGGNFRELANLRERLYFAARSGRVDVTVLQRALAEGSLIPVACSAPEPTPSPLSEGDFAELATRAVNAFASDHGEPPHSWNDQKEWNEKYLKPLLFQHLAGAPARIDPADESAFASLASRAANRAGADRGTAIKQLTRYYERFQGSDESA